MGHEQEEERQVAARGTAEVIKALGRQALCHGRDHILPTAGAAWGPPLATWGCPGALQGRGCPGHPRVVAVRVMLSLQWLCSRPTAVPADLSTPRLGLRGWAKEMVLGSCGGGGGGGYVVWRCPAAGPSVA